MTAANVRFDGLPRRRATVIPIARSTMMRMVVPASTEPAGEVPQAAVRDALEKVLRSRAFFFSKRHRSFLRYVVDGTLAGRAHSLKEIVIGLDVFARDLDGFDPRRDSIVRVEARRLRKKLDKYYATEGRLDPVEIGLAAGSYVPTFSRREPAKARAAAPLLIVLPLRMPGDGEACGWSIGLAEQLVDRLGSLDFVRVMAPFATTKVRDPELIDALRSDHGIDYVIEGSVTRVGSSLRCAMFLSATIDHLRLWSQTCDFDLKASGDGASDILFQIQDYIADTVAGAVRSLVTANA